MISIIAIDFPEPWYMFYVHDHPPALQPVTHKVSGTHRSCACSKGTEGLKDERRPPTDGPFMPASRPD